MTAMAGRNLFLLLRYLGDEAFGGQQQAGDGSRVLERGASDFLGVHHTGFDEVFVFGRRDVVAFIALPAFDLFHHDRAFDAGVVRQSAGRELNGALDDVHPDPVIILGDRHGFDRRQATDQGHATAWHDAFFNRGASRMQRVFDTGLLLLHFGLGRRADVDDRDATGQLGQAFLQFLAIVVGGGFLDLTTDLIDPALDLGGFAEPFDDGGVFFVHHNALGAAEVVEFKALQFDAEVFADEL